MTFEPNPYRNSISQEKRVEQLHKEKCVRTTKNYPLLIEPVQQQALSVVGMRVWLLQGVDLVRTGRLIPDLFSRYLPILLGFQYPM